MRLVGRTKSMQYRAGHCRSIR